MTETYEGYSAASPPPAGWRPYAPTSPVNEPVNTAPVAESATIAARLTKWGSPSPGNLTAGAPESSDYGHPVYYASTTDPLVTLKHTEPWGTCPIDGLCIPLPAQARPAGGSDKHMCVITPDGWQYDLWRAQVPAGGVLTFGWGNRISIDGSGLGGWATASHLGLFAGIIRPEELAAGEINHALFATVRGCTAGVSFGNGVTAGSNGSSSYVRPASHGGSISIESGAPPMGARLHLALTASEIEALKLPAWKRAVVAAAAEHGILIGDTGGPGFGLQFQSALSYTAFGLPNPFVEIAQREKCPTWEGVYVFNLASGVPWTQRLRVVAPPSPTA